MRLKKTPMKMKGQETIQLRMIGPEEVRLMNEVKMMLQDPKSLKLPSYREVVLYCLNVVKDQRYQENGAEKRKKTMIYDVQTKENNSF